MANTWSLPQPTELASSYSPCRLRTIPTAGDLLCVWNQVSGDEIRRGLRRSRGCTSRYSLFDEDHLARVGDRPGLQAIQIHAAGDLLAAMVAAINGNLLNAEL